ncbi:MAG: hypothetical protein VYE40_00115 [Myxococcota bacterium]|nr:hypothetical protein [Myxococcota bacterium]
MKKGILIAFAFGLMGAAVVMVYSMTTWQQPLTPLLYASLGVVPLSLGGALAIIFDEIDRAAWWKDSKVFACFFAALVASLALPAAWAAPKVRANMLHQFASPELAMSALTLDRDHDIRLRACNMLIHEESRQISTELTSRLANSPRLGLDCIEGARDKKQAKDVARRVALRWHAGLVGLSTLDDEHTTLLVTGLKTLPLIPQQQVTTLFDCAVRGATPTARKLCAEALAGKPKRACAGLTGLLTPRRLNEWGVLGVALGASWGEPEATKANAELISKTDLTCPEAKDFSLEATCNAIVEDTMSREDRRYFEWVLSNNTQCLKPEHIEEWVSARDVCDLILEAKDQGKRLDEIIVCDSRLTVAKGEIERREMALAEAEKQKTQRESLASDIVMGSTVAAGGNADDIGRSMLGRNGDCFTDRQVGHMVGQMFKSKDGEFNALDLMEGDPVKNTRKMLDSTLEANTEVRKNAKVREKMKNDPDIDQEDLEEALAEFEEDEETGERNIDKLIEEQFEDVEGVGRVAFMDHEEREYVRCLRSGRKDCVPAKQRESGFTEDRPCVSAFPDSPGGLDEHILKMQQVRPW